MGEKPQMGMMWLLLVLTTASSDSRQPSLSWLPPWGMCGIYLPKFQTINSYASDVCTDCHHLLKTQNPDAGVFCREKCFTTPFFLYCARLLGPEEPAANLTKLMINIDSWWLTTGRHLPENSAYAKAATRHFKKKLASEL